MQLFVGFTCSNCSVRVVLKQRKIEKELEMASNMNKNAIWALLFSLLMLIITFQKNCHNNQLLVTPNEISGGLYCRDMPLNDLPPFLSGSYLVLAGSSH